MVHPRHFLCLLVLGLALAACQPTKRAKPVTSDSDAPKISEVQTIAEETKVTPEISEVATTQRDNNTNSGNQALGEDGLTSPVSEVTEAAVELTAEDAEPELVPIPIKPPAAPRQLYPQFMLGKVTTDLQETFGAPTVERIEGHVKVWQYRGNECVVDFYLYPEDEHYTVTHWHWRHPIVGQALDPLSCRIERAKHFSR